MRTKPQSDNERTRKGKWTFTEAELKVPEEHDEQREYIQSLLIDWLFRQASSGETRAPDAFGKTTPIPKINEEEQAR